MHAEKVPVQLACRPGGDQAGYYDWRSREPSARSLRHAWPTEQIQAVHQASFGTYGRPQDARRAALGLDIAVGHGAVEMLVRRAGSAGLPDVGDVARSVTPRSCDLVDRNFSRDRPDELWVTDIERHEALLNRVEVGDLHRRVVAAAR
jgi:putative transposase